MSRAFRGGTRIREKRPDLYAEEEALLAKFPTLSPPDAGTYPGTFTYVTQTGIFPEGSLTNWFELSVRPQIKGEKDSGGEERT